MPKHRTEIFLGLTRDNAIFCLCTIVSVVALGKMGEELDCKAPPEASPALWGSLLEDRVGQENAENVYCSLVMCNTRARLSTEQQELPRCFQEQPAALREGGKGHIPNYLDLGASSQLWVRVWKHKSFTKATVFICCWSHCPTWICLMPFKIHFQSPQPPEALTATMQLRMVGKSTSFWVCLF